MKRNKTSPTNEKIESYMNKEELDKYIKEKFEDIHTKMLNKQFVSAGTLIRFRDACIKQGYTLAKKEEREKYSQALSKALRFQREDVLKKIDECKIIKDEFCQCGCSKKAHLPHQLDKNGGRCGICVHCDGYTWKGFEFVELETLKASLKNSQEKKYE